MNSRWKYFLILILAVVLLHILIIKIFIIGSDNPPAVNSNVPELIDGDKLPEPPVPPRPRKK